MRHESNAEKERYPLLANISTRGFVETDDNVMIGGFIAGNQSGPTKVVIRAIGPSLSNFGVPNPLQDPILELHDGNGNTFATNDNWQDDPGAAEIQFDKLAPNDSRESATLQTLAPGAYSAIVRGKDNTTGVGLVEIYNVQSLERADPQVGRVTITQRRRRQRVREGGSIRLLLERG